MYLFMFSKLQYLRGSRSIKFLFFITGMLNAAILMASQTAFILLNFQYWGLTVSIVKLILLDSLLSRTSRLMRKNCKLVWLGQAYLEIIIVSKPVAQHYPKHPQISRTLNLATQILGKQFFERSLLYPMFNSLLNMKIQYFKVFPTILAL